MKQSKLMLLGAALTAFLSVSAQEQPVDYVNPFVGTTNYGTTNPGAVLPQGMMSATPFNVMGSDLNKFDKDKQWWSTPYDVTNKYLTGFSHVNLSGVGCPDLGSLLLMPTTGELNVNYRQYGSEYTDEEATPGYYRNKLSKYNVQCEMTATLHTSRARFTFPAGQSNILLNLGEGLTNESGASVRFVNDCEIEGSKLLGTFCYNPQAVFPIYFVMRIHKAPEERGYWKMQRPMGVEAQWDADAGKYKLYTNYGRVMSGDDIGAWFTYNTQAGETLEVSIGVSFVSIENARLNLDTEQPAGTTFDQLRADAREKWNEDLSRILVEGGTEEQKGVFYTALYHAMIHPNILQDVNGQYPMMESDSILTTTHNRYTVFSLWDTYRNVHQLMTLVYPERQMDMIRTMMGMYQEHGWFPKWELYGRETLTMEGDPSIPVIVDSWMKGLRDFDINLAYEGMYKSATTPGKDNLMRPDIDEYIKRGYCPMESQFDNSVSHALEYYIADYSLSTLAKALGKKEDAKMFYDRSMGYSLFSVRPAAGSQFRTEPGLPRRQFLELYLLCAARCQRTGQADGWSEEVHRQAADGVRQELLRPGQRTGHRLSVPVQLLQGRGMENTEAGERAAGETFHDEAERHTGQRRYRYHVFMGHLQHDGLLSRLSGRSGIYLYPAYLRQGDHQAGPGLLGNRQAGAEEGRGRRLHQGNPSG